MKKLNVLEENTSAEVFIQQIKPKTSREKTQARFDREWLLNPDQFNPMNNILGKVRIESILNFARKHLTFRGVRIVDLGCGYGVLSKLLRDLGAQVDAVDISKNALACLNNEEGIRPIQAFIPYTHLGDNEYDLVVCADLIGHIPEREHRLLINELARLAKRDGAVLFSTSIDIHSEDALEKLITLIQTEFEIQQYSLSCHSKFIRIKNFFSTPQRFSQASKNSRIRAAEIEKRRPSRALWFKVNSSKIAAWIWTVIAPFTNLIVNYLNRSRSVLFCLEKMSKSEDCVSHICILAKRKSIYRS